MFKELFDRFKIQELIAFRIFSIWSQVLNRDPCADANLAASPERRRDIEATKIQQHT